MPCSLSLFPHNMRTLSEKINDMTFFSFFSSLISLQYLSLLTCFTQPNAIHTRHVNEFNMPQKDFLLILSSGHISSHCLILPCQCLLSCPCSTLFLIHLLISLVLKNLLVRQSMNLHFLLSYSFLAFTFFLNHSYAFTLFGFLKSKCLAHNFPSVSHSI